MPDRKYDSSIFKLLNALGLSDWIQSEAESALDTGNSTGIEDERPVRHVQTRQYREPEKDILPLSEYRPTSLTKFQDQKFRSVARFLPEYISLREDKLPSVDQLRKGPVKLKSPVMAGGKGADEYSDLFGSPTLQRVLGLGNANMSLGFDPERNQPYLSIFDSWDFNTGPGNGEQFFGFDALRNAGTPFNIYDRVYFGNPHYPDDPLSRFITPKKEPVVGDIELPSDPKDQDPRTKGYIRRKIKK